MEKAADLPLPAKLFTSSLGAGAHLRGGGRRWPSCTPTLVITPLYRRNKAMENPLLLMGHRESLAQKYVTLGELLIRQRCQIIYLMPWCPTFHVGM